MSICPLSEDTLPLELISKIVTCDLKNPENYLEGLVIITTCICLRCQTIIRLEVSDFSL